MAEPTKGVDRIATEAGRALLAVASMKGDDIQHVAMFGNEWLDRILTIEAQAVAPWREALWHTRVVELNIDGSPCWCPEYPTNGHTPACERARALLADKP